MDAAKKNFGITAFLQRWSTRPPYCFLSDARIKWLAERAVPLVHEAGRFLRSQNCPFAGIELIEHGNVALVSYDPDGVEIVFRQLGPGDIYGFTALFCDGGAVFGTRAVNRVSVFALSAEDVINLADQDIATKDYFHRESMARMRQAYLNVQARMVGPDHPRADGNALPAKLKKSIALIKARYADPLTLEDAAAVCGISKFYYSRLFKSALGCSFKEYLNRVRIEAAKDMLRQEKFNVSEACYAVGYNDLSYFSRVFKRLEKRSPSEYRRSLQRLLIGIVSLFLDGTFSMLL